MKECNNKFHDHSLKYPMMSASSRANRFHHMQLRSVLDSPGAAPDHAWQAMLRSGCALSQVDTDVWLTLPGAAESEASLLGAIEALARAFESHEDLLAFHRHFGWTSPESYFSERGQNQVMVVDVDYNDVDDRLAIIVLAYQVASANAERRRHTPTATCRIFLDGRTYERSSGLTMWRTLELAARLRNILMSQAGIDIVPVLSEPEYILGAVASYLGVPATYSSLDARVPGTGDLLRSHCREDIRSCCAPGARTTVWLLGGLCHKQVSDIGWVRDNVAGAHLTIYEQAAPAWQSVQIGRTEVQPSWSFPPDVISDGCFGAEPSNIRSSAEDYPGTVEVYLQLQKVVAASPASFTYICPAMSRKDGFLPVPPGQVMPRIWGRPLNVAPGIQYHVHKAIDLERTGRVFAQLTEAARARLPDTVYEELCINGNDDSGSKRPELEAVSNYGSFLADAILVCVGSVPLEMLRATKMTRRLAFVSLTVPVEKAL